MAEKSWDPHHDHKKAAPAMTLRYGTNTASDDNMKGGSPIDSTSDTHYYAPAEINLRREGRETA